MLDEATREKVASIPLGKGPASLLATPTRDKLYSANWGDKTVSSIDPKKASARTLAMPGRPYVIALSPDGTRLYAGFDTSTEIVVIDAANDAELKRFKTPELPASIIVSADGATLYVADLGSVIPGLGSPGSLCAISAEDGASSAPPRLCPPSAPLHLCVDLKPWAQSAQTSLALRLPGLAGNVRLSRQELADSQVARGGNSHATSRLLLPMQAHEARLEACYGPSRLPRTHF